MAAIFPQKCTRVTFLYPLFDDRRKDDMRTAKIIGVVAEDRRFDLEDGAGQDAINRNSQYSYGVCRLKTDAEIDGVGITFALGTGTNLICAAIQEMSAGLIGREINELMQEFGKVFTALSDNFPYRWMGPHKGIVHLAVASITNACFDLWAKTKGVPLWKLLIDLKPEEIVSLLDFRYVEDLLTKNEALGILRAAEEGKAGRMKVLETGYDAYDTSVGWFNYSDEKVADNARRSLDQGFRYVKLKVGAPDPAVDIRRAALLRDVIGGRAEFMVDCNQQWTLHQALDIIRELNRGKPFFVEEPTDPDDVLAHQTLVRVFPETRIALGEHVPNKVVFKNYLQAGAVGINQVDATRVGGISEFILISLMSKKCRVPVAPHAGDMGQIHQHMVLFNHISLNHPHLFMEYILHLRKYFRFPIMVENAKFITPQNPGSSCDFID